MDGVTSNRMIMMLRRRKSELQSFFEWNIERSRNLLIHGGTAISSQDREVMGWTLTKASWTEKELAIGVDDTRIQQIPNKTRRKQ